MSEEMREKRKKELEELEAGKNQQILDEESTRDDCCPMCTAKTHSFPYVAVDPIYGRLECPSCGLVFVPLSIRKLKLEKAQQKIKVPKLVVPA